MNCGVLLPCRQAMLLGVAALWGLAAEHSVLGACFWVDVLCCFSKNLCTTRKQGVLAQCSSPVRLLLHSVINHLIATAVQLLAAVRLRNPGLQLYFPGEIRHALCHAQTSRQTAWGAATIMKNSNTAGRAAAVKTCQSAS
jgi:hypothetical protein